MPVFRQFMIYIFVFRTDRWGQKRVHRGGGGGGRGGGGEGGRRGGEGEEGEGGRAQDELSRGPGPGG